MSDGALAALITAAGAIVVALVGVLSVWVQNRKHSSAIEVVRSQVQNSHGTNLRDDLDVIRSLIEAQGEKQDSLASDVRGVRKDIGRLDERDIERGRDLRAVTSKLEIVAGEFAAHQRQAERDHDRLSDIERTIEPGKDS